MRETVRYWKEHGFADVEFRNVRLLDAALYDILEILEAPVFSRTATVPWRTLSDIGGGVYLIRYDDPLWFESAKSEFPSDTEILQDGSILPRYFGEFEKDGKKYVIVDCEEKLADADKSEDWVEGTYRNLIFDRRKDSEKVAYGVKKSTQDALNSSADTK